jgi:hypothetical protein
MIVSSNRPPTTTPEDRPPERDDFVTDAEIARRWKVSEKTARGAIRQLERVGFPKKDPLFANKRYWPAVKAFIDRRYGLGTAAPSGPSDIRSQEDWGESKTIRRSRLK